MDERRLLAIGNLAVEAANLEVIMFGLTHAAVGGTYKVFQAIAAQQSFEQLASLTTRVLIARGLMTEEIKQWIVTAKAIMVKRNLYLHGVTDNDTGNVFNRRSTPALVEVESEEIDAIANEANAHLASALPILVQLRESVGDGGIGAELSE